MSEQGGVRQVVTVDVSTSGIATVCMVDREHRNTFSPELIDGLSEAFSSIARSDSIRTVVLTGYETYFCCGGTKDELLSYHEGRRTFDEGGFYRLLLDCDLPVICAMQGHAVGAGLAFGCYADMIVMAEEALYSASFMKYGFTPGFGATWVIPQKMGSLLGAEMLFTARSYHGAELRKRGAQPLVVRRGEVLSASLGLAADLAEKPPIALRLLKAQFRQLANAVLPRIVEDELAMHRQTFGRAEVRDRIEGLF